MRTCVVVLAAIVLGSGVAAYGDGGMIPFIPNVQLFEPNQRAVIAWDGQEEILILSTDTYASTPTKALEVIPLRAEPTVKKGDPEIFEKATRLINNQNSYRRPLSGAYGGAAPSAAAPAPAGAVTQHERIGRHEISVTHVLDVNGFCTWAEKYLRSQGADAPRVPDPIRVAVQGYLERGFAWFVYDVVELGTTVRTNEPIQFRFKSDCVFYPLVITQTESQHVDIRILLLTAEYLWQYPELPRDHIRVGLQHSPNAQNIAQEMVVLSRRQVQHLSPDVDALLGHRDGMKLRIWTLIPEMRGRFFHDLVAR